MQERRKFFRLKKRLKVEFKIIIEKFASTVVPPNISYTDTISGNGLVLLYSKIIDKGTKLEMSIELQDESKTKIELAGEVIGYNKIDENQYEIKIKFIDIDEKYRDKLVGYLLKESVKNKKKKNE
ncbi:MAG: PilZ domain-containing protein [Candidatus Goldbacteria bacterium]|nr:PilZ domain-containing protein [Candidatus Goldiibacteriota bacterium]